MATDENIFDIDNTSDIPSNIVKDIKFPKPKRVSTANLVYTFFKIKPKLSINEILVGFYRAYGIEKTRQQIMSAIYQLISTEWIKRSSDYAESRSFELAKKESN